MRKKVTKLISISLVILVCLIGYVHFMTFGEPIKFAESFKEALGAGHYFPVSINSIAWTKVENGQELKQISPQMDFSKKGGFVFAIEGSFKIEGAYQPPGYEEPTPTKTCKYVFISWNEKNTAIQIWNVKGSYTNLAKVGHIKVLSKYLTQIIEERIVEAPTQATQKTVLDRAELSQSMNIKIDECSGPSKIKFEDIVRKAINSSPELAKSAKGINAELVDFTQNGGVFTDEVLSKVPSVKNGKGISKTKVWIVTFSGVKIHPGNGPAGLENKKTIKDFVSKILGKDIGSLNRVYDATTGLFLTGFASR